MTVTEPYLAMFRALSSPVRLQLISLLAAAPNGLNIKEAEERLGSVKQPTVSFHLATLVRCGLATRTVDGPSAVHHLNRPAFTEVALLLRVYSGEHA